MSWSRALPDPASVPWPSGWELDWVAEVDSTNEVLARSGPVRAGDPPAVARVLAADRQSAGRGRAGRDWQCPAGAGLMFSVRLPLADIPAGRRGWIGAVLGLAVVESVPVPAVLKWPNDVMVGAAKLAGVLAEQVGDDVVVGTGLNVSLTVDELPRPDAVSLRLAGAAEVDRPRLLGRILSALADRLDRWRAAGGDVDASGLRADYRRACTTLGREVRVLLPGGVDVRGRAVDVDPAGSLVVQGPDGVRAFAAADVVHLR